MADRVNQLLSASATRRTFVVGVVGSAVATLLAACGGSSKATATKPAAAVTSTTSTGGAPTATKAAASATSGGGSASPSASSGTPSTASTSSTGSTGGTTPTTAAPTPAGNATQGGEIIIGTLGEAQTINPFASAESEGDWRVKMLFDQVVRLDPQTFEAKPGLAEKWENQDLTFTFTLRDGLKFSDGSDLTADDVAFTLLGILAQKTGSPRYAYFSSIQGAQEYNSGSAQDVPGVKVVDPKTISITLATPNAAFLINMRYLSPVPKAALDGKDLSLASTDPFFQNPIGGGPFKFVSWAVGGDFVAERNDNFYEQGKPYLDKFTHRVIADSQSLVNALLSGDIDASIYPSPAGADKLKADKDLTVVVPPFTSPDGWQFNLAANPYLAKKEARQAVAYALDMEQFAKDSLYGLGQPGVGPIAPGNWAFDKTLKPYAYDMDKAKSLIQQAGTPPSGIVFFVNQGNVLREDFLTYTQQQLKQLGWEIDAQTIEYATLTDDVTKKNFQVSGVVFTGATVDPGDLRDQFSTNGSQNYSGYSNPQLDQLLDQAVQELDKTKAADIYKQIQAIIMEDVPTHFAWYRPFLHCIKTKFQGWVDSADEGGLFYELENVYVNNG